MYTQYLFNKNFKNLLLNNSINIIAPLISIFYVFNKIGAENFAYISFSTALIGFLSFIIEFGLITSSIRLITEFSKNRIKLSEIATATLIIKLILFSIVLFFLLLYFIKIDPFNEFKPSLIFSVGILFGQALNLNYFFLGLKETSLLTKINLASKLFSTILLLIFIQDESDYLYWPIIYSIIAVLTSVYSIYILYKKYYIKIITPSLKIIVENFIDGLHIFITNLAGCFLVYGPTLILGLISSKFVLGNFGLADRISSILVIFFLSISQTITPELTSLYIKNKNNYIKLIYKKLIKNSFIILITGYILFYTFIDSILNKIFSNDSNILSNILKLVGLYSIFICFNTIAMPFMIISKLDKKLSLIYLIVAISFTIGTYFILIFNFNFYFLFYLIFILQIFIFISISICVNKKFN
jgi:PST family polysaccharide transporter